MAGRAPSVGHVRESLIRAGASAMELTRSVAALSSLNPNVAGPRLHPEHARRVVELAFLGLVSAWEEFLERSFVRYLSGAKSESGYAAPLRMGKASSIEHAYHLISGDPDYDPSKNYSRFSEPKWVISTARNYMEQGAPYATRLQPNLQILQEAIRLRNRVAHNSSKCREDFKRSARVHLGLAADAPMVQGYGVGDLLTSPARLLFGQQARDRNWSYFQAYVGRFGALAASICPES